MSGPAAGGRDARIRSRLVWFDRERFADDVAEYMKKHGRGATRHTALATGLDKNTVHNVWLDSQRQGGHFVDSIQTVLNLCEHLGLRLEDYVHRNTRPVVPIRPLGGRPGQRGGNAEPSPLYDWRLVALCAGMICRDDPFELAREVKCGLQVAKRILAGDGCAEGTFRELCRKLHLRPDQLEKDFNLVELRGSVAA